MLHIRTFCIILFSLSKYTTQNLHFPAHKIACSMGRHLHDSKPMISQSFCFHQFSSRGTLNLVSLIFLWSQGCTFWIHTLNFQFSNGFPLRISGTKTPLLSGYRINTTRGFCNQTIVELSSQYAQGPNHQACLLIPITFKDLTGKLLMQI